MRKFLFTIFLIGLFVVLLDPAGNLLSKFLRLEQPTFHEIKMGEWLSKIAQQYYADASYWKELCLVNRAPDGNLIFPGEKIIIPSFETIKEIRKSRRLSAVNKLVDVQNDILAGKIPSQKAPIVSNESEKSAIDSHVQTAAKQSDGLTPVFQDDEQATDKDSGSTFITQALMVGVLLFGLVLITVIYLVRKRQREEISVYGASDENNDNSKMKKNIFLDDFAEEHHEDDDNLKKNEVKVG